MSGEIVVCYRRDDAPEAAARLQAALGRLISEADVVPLDELLSSLRPNDRRAPAIHTCETLVVVAGRSWSDRLAANGEATPLDAEIAAAAERGVALVLVQVGSTADSASPPRDWAFAGRALERQSYLRLGMTKEHLDKDVPLVAEAIINASRRAAEAAQRAARRKRRRRRAAIVVGAVGAAAIAASVLRPLVVRFMNDRQIAELARPASGGLPTDAAARASQCHLLAASPLDPARPLGFAGVPFNKIDTAKAIETCERAYAAEPANLAVAFELARSYDAANPKDGPDLNRAYALASEAAERGYAIAMLELAHIKSRRNSHWLDDAGAAAWYDRAAQAGVRSALTDAAHALSMKKDASAEEKARAVAWARQAVDQGVAEGMVVLGDLYYDGFGVAKDRAQAADWFAKAADKDVAMAMVRLGDMYRDGDGVASNPAKAAELFAKAAKDDENGAYNLGWLYAHGTGVPQDLAKAREFYRSAAERGVTGAMINLGQFCEHGWGGAQDPECARHWYEEADKRGEPVGANNLGWCYEAGIGVARSYRKAMSYYTKAADAGLPLAMANLGWLYATGTPTDFDRAYTWLYKAAAAGSELGQMRLGILYWNGQGVPQSYERAVFLWKQMAEKGDDGSAAWLGIAVYEGKGTPKDETLGRQILQSAADAGNDFAKTYLSKLPPEPKAPK